MIREYKPKSKYVQTTKIPTTNNREVRRMEAEGTEVGGGAEVGGGGWSGGEAELGGGAGSRRG